MTGVGAGCGSETGRTLVGDSEGLLEGNADATQGAFLEEAADQGDAVGHAARGRKLWQRIFRIRGPVRARFGNFDEAGRVPGETRLALPKAGVFRYHGVP
jgi:hypothetical protein